MRVTWPAVLEHGAEIVLGYDTGVTLRQLFYRLVVDGTLPNVQTYYRRLSGMTAEGRRDGSFPDLLDRTSRIERFMSFEGPDAAKGYILDVYRRDRTEGQDWTIYFGVEKAGMSEQLNAWFTDPLGIPHVALGGYASQSLADEVGRDIAAQGRPSVLIYAGDLDPSGEDVDRDFEARVGFDKVVRVALSAEQVEEYDLVENSDPVAVAKVRRDPRAEAFLRRHGSLMQYEVDALDPETLRNLYRNALADFWDDDLFQAVIDREDDEKNELA